MMKPVGIVLMIVGVAGFIGGTESKSDYEIVSKSGSTKSAIDESVQTEAGHSYQISAWGCAEETGLQKWASMSGELVVTGADGKQLYRKAFSASASSSEETGGVRRAQNGTEFRYQAEADGKIQITGKLTEGDSLEVKVYEDLSEASNLLPGLSIILGIAGLVLFLRSRA